MATINPPRQLSKRHELREDQVITFYARAWAYFDQNRKVVYGLGAGLALVLVAFVGYLFYQQQQEVKAQELLGTIVGEYEAGNYRVALDGSEGRPGLLAIADDFGGTDAGNLASFYAADALFSLGEYDQALAHFQDFDAEENFIGASAVAGQAAVYETKEDYRRAGDLYRRAALMFENDLMSPRYLLDAGRSFEAGGAYDEAREAYALIQERFPESSQASGIEFYLARIDALTQAQ